MSLDRFQGAIIMHQPIDYAETTLTVQQQASVSHYDIVRVAMAPYSLTWLTLSGLRCYDAIDQTAECFVKVIRWHLI